MSSDDAAAASESWLEACLGRLGRARVAVFGDFCLDAYWIIAPDEGELSVETGLPVRRVREQRYSLGGAGNVVANVAALAVQSVQAVGLVGEDLFGREMLRLLEEIGVGTAGMLCCQADWQTMVYSKPCIGQDEQNRIDFGGFNEISAGAISALAGELDRAAGQSDAVILNQQVPAGVSTPEMIKQINAVVARHADCLFLADSRHRPGLYRRTMLKINAHEGAELLGRPRPLEEAIGEDEAGRIAQALFERRGGPVFLTRGENGIIVADGSGVAAVPGIQVTGPTDPVGAGDTVAAALAAALAGGADALAAAKLANIAASVTVRKLQTTGTATPAEIRQAGLRCDSIHLPELAATVARARYLEDTAIEVVRPLPERRQIRHALFDHDGTVSTLRQGWQQVMEPMMVRCILAGRPERLEPRLRQAAAERVRDLIDTTTGAQTLVQMQGLVELVRRFGLVAERDVLDIHGYKAIYNRELMAVVGRRLEKLRSGELGGEDFQIRGARTLLERLHARGVRLYLASGTDQADVVAEAEALGYADLFEGRIFGAVGDVRVEAKQVVLERIIGEHELAGPAFATFGDGPVEIRQTRKRGGICIGVASDEIRRCGLNVEKRRRLIRAGADLIIPDYSQPDRLLQLLFPDD